MKGLQKFPEEFLWGSATSSHQVEGGNHNEWSEWEKHAADSLGQKANGRVNRENFISGQACDHYNRFREDFDIAKSLRHNAHRFSLEWSRIEPEEGKFDQEAIMHYRQVLTALRERGLEPFVTIWHWTNPIWVRDKGGWENKKTIEYFVRFSKRVAEEYKDLVKFWIPLNEPETYIGVSFVQGRFPPQKTSFRIANKVFKNLMQAHKEVYRTIKSISPQAQVGASHYALYMDAYQDCWYNRILVRFLRYFRSRRFWNSLQGYRDFFGLQYYHHDRIALSLGGKWGLIEVRNENKVTTDNGWEIYPEGLYYLLKEISKYKEPIYITENGIADAADTRRADFIKDHVEQVRRAIAEGVEVRGYFYWSLLDNFEWDNGYQARFGLVEVDYKTQARKIRPSAWEYKKMIQNVNIKM